MSVDSERACTNHASAAEDGKNEARAVGYRYILTLLFYDVPDLLHLWPNRGILLSWKRPDADDSKGAVWLHFKQDFWDFVWQLEAVA